MNKFEFISGEIKINVGDIVSFRKDIDWRKESTKNEINRWITHDSILDENDQFEVKLLYQDDIFHIKSTKSGHEQIVHFNWIQKEEKSTKVKKN